MVLFGTFVNGLTIIVGSLCGLLFTNVQEKYKTTIMHGIGLAVLLIGLQMAFSSELIIVILLSLLTGAILGEFFSVEDHLNQFGQWLERKVPSRGEGQMVEGFVTATLIFSVGAMAILGALDSGLRGDHEILITKAILDGFTSMVLTTTFGFGVVLSFIPVVLYQGTIALLATQIERFVPETLLQGMVTELTAVGGLLILAIGLNLLKITKIRIGNLLPSVVTVCVIYYIYQLF